jgi:hypothetical protein
MPAVTAAAAATVAVATANVILDGFLAWVRAWA